MRLLLDEMFSPLVARGLRDRGQEALAIGEIPHWRGRTDGEVLQLARDERRAVATNNFADFARLHQWAIVPGGSGHSGIVLVPSAIRRHRADPGVIVELFERLMIEHPTNDALADSIVWLSRPDEVLDR